MQIENLPDIANRVFARLQASGPLCPSQISVDLGIRVTAVQAGLIHLWKKGLAEKGSNPEAPYDSDDAASEFEDPWRIRFRGKRIRQQRQSTAERPSA